MIENKKRKDVKERENHVRDWIMRRHRENEARGSERGTGNVSYQRLNKKIITKVCSALLLLSYEKGWSFVWGDGGGRR